jgi:hypothetical protein
MSLKLLRRVIDSEPFVPCRLVLVAGGWKAYDIPDRAAIEFAEDGVIVRDKIWGERWVDPRLIAAIEFGGPVRPRADQDREADA